MSEQKQNAAEIDLAYFFKPLGTLFKKTGDGLDYLGRKIRRNFWLFTIIVVLFAVVGFLARYYIKPAYQTQGIFISNILPGKYCSILLDNLNKLKGENNPILAQQLKISEEAAGDIQSIGMSSLRDTFVVERKDSALSVFNITLTLRSMHHLDTIQSALVNYLENNDYARKRKLVRRQSLQAMRENLNYRRQSLDSLKKIVSSSIVPRSQGTGIILGEPIDPVSIYQVELNYYREQLSIDQALAIIDGIEIIQPFYRLNQTNYPGYNRIMALVFITGLIFATLVIIFFGRRPK